MDFQGIGIRRNLELGDGLRGEHLGEVGRRDVHLVDRHRHVPIQWEQILLRHFHQLLTFPDHTAYTTYTSTTDHLIEHINRIFFGKTFSSDLIGHSECHETRFAVKHPTNLDSIFSNSMLPFLLYEYNNH